MRRLYRVHLIGIILFAFTLRLYHLDAQSIWVDGGKTFVLLPTTLTIRDD